MRDLNAIRFEPHGPAGIGLVEGAKIDPDELTAGEPVQRSHNYFTDDTSTVKAGVWDCTPMTTKLAPYDVNEFMHVLEGTVTIIDQKGHEETIHAGASFVIPKGMPCIWKQTEYMRKFYFLFNDLSGAAPEDPARLKVLRIDPNVDLAPLEQQDVSRYRGGVPTQHIHTCFSDRTGQMTAGVWDTTEMHTRPLPFPRNELMHILSGSVAITNGDGVSQTFHKGDTFFVPEGMSCQWDNERYVRKIYCLFQPK